jgi:uncharacterized membrane protein
MGVGMELMGLLMLVLGLLLVGPVMAIIALVRTQQLQRKVAALELSLRAPAARPAPEAPSAAPVMAPPAVLPPAPPPVEVPPPVELPRPAAESRPSPPVRPAAARDFATTLGPRILVAAGALAFVVSLGLFVKYAWENDWVGPTGRVLLGAVAGLALIAVGVRMLGSRYRPLGQGLAGAGLAGLYVSAFGAHGFYQLIPREAAGVLMAAITANAVMLAVRLDARLLAGLAWVGGYLTPVLLSTGEDKAIALYLYLTLLNVGALVLDHRRPWPETAPLAMMGTLVLYTGWYGQFFRPERFEVAALGVVLFTATFAFGLARKERGGLLGVALLFGAMGVSALAAGADRPAWLLSLSLGLGLASVRLLGPRKDAAPMVAALAVAVPFMAWAFWHYRPESLLVAAAWVVGGALLLTLPELRDAALPSQALTAATLAGAAVASVGLAHRTDRPLALLLFLLAQAGVAMAARRRFRGSEVIGLAGAALSVLAWMDAFFKPDRAGDALLLALPTAAVYLGSLVIRAARGRELAAADIAEHLGNAAFVWLVVERVLRARWPDLLGPAAAALAVLYLTLGLLALRARTPDRRRVRTELGLAAVFVTLAIPVQLGLHGITLGWALEGALLLALGLRFGSTWARAGGYTVLLLAIARLFSRHGPLDVASAVPFLNAAFGTWLAVIATVAVSFYLLRRASPAPGEGHLARPALAAAALGLLFVLLTWETSGTFEREERLARLAADLPAAEAAGLRGALALSVLWTVFATGLLAGGLAARSRPLFYSAYALFALTAFKVVFVDLATLHTVYRMLSFLALALLLMAGAYLNLRFRERLLPREAAP